MLKSTATARSEYTAKEENHQGVKLMTERYKKILTKK